MKHSHTKFQFINPKVDYVLDLVNYFKTLHNLDNVHIYLSISKETYIFNYHKRKYSFVKTIGNAKKLIKNLMYINNVNKTSTRNQTIDYQIFDEVEPFLNSNDLVVFKGDLKSLNQILIMYDNLKNKYFDHRMANSSFYRFLIWIPESESQKSFNQNIYEYEKVVNNLIKICQSFKIFILNWLVDVDSVLNKLIDNAIAASNQQNDFNLYNSLLFSGKFTLKVLSSFDFFSTKSSKSFRKITNCQSKDYANISDQFLFKIKDNKLYFLDSNDQIKKSNYQKFSFVQASVNKHKEKTFKPSYRIVSNQVEPFVIVSQLDEHLVSKDECKDGLPCLDIESDEVLYSRTQHNDLNLTQELNNIFNKELMIGLIKSFKLVADDQMQSNKTSLVKTKCCTGYMINLLQKLSNDLDFNFEFYLTHDKILDRASPTSESATAINHVISGVAHIVAGPFSITQSRARDIDFSAPFLYSGYALLIKQEKKGVDDLFMFMKPFTNLHWALIGFFAFGSAFALALLEFNSPFGLNPKGRQRARNYTLGSAISMVISLMFMHTMPAKSPKSWAGKWTQNFIASFALIFIATYTAQMASLLSAGQESRAFKGVDDSEV